MPIRVQGANEHNLQNVDVEFGDGLTVVTGVSGSGKTSLVFDTLYHEADRRFREVFSLGVSQRLSPAAVREIIGLGPAVAVGQNLLNRNPGSTLATASGLHPFLRLLFARFGERHCPRCGSAISFLNEDETVEQLMRTSARGPMSAFAPLLRGVRGSHRTLLQTLASAFDPTALRVDGRSWQSTALDPSETHDLDVEVGRWESAISATDARAAIRDAAALGAQALVVRSADADVSLSRTPQCLTCGHWLLALDATHFHRPCPHCNGQGCPRCEDTGLLPEAAAVRWHGLRLPGLLALSVDEAQVVFAKVEMPSTAGRLHQEIGSRLCALARVGLGYVALDRPSPTLSRGEAQRVRLAVALTSRLEDMLHVLDEPTIGQHPADVARLLPAFRDLAGPVIYVEHDRIAAASADWALDLGPGAGSQGGQVTFTGTPAGLWQSDTATGRFFSLRERVASPARRPKADRFLTLRGAHLRNLCDIDVRIPQSRLTVITGVSGSGKSTLVEDVLYASLHEGKPVGCRTMEGPSLKATMVDQNPIGRNPRSNPATFTKLANTIRDCFAAATALSPSHFSFNRPEGACEQCKGMGAIEVRMRYLPSTWITCAACGGQRFSDEVLGARALFEGKRLNIAEFYDLTIAEAAPLLMGEKRLSDTARASARRILRALRDVGLGYLTLGQPSPTLSGGEAQRVKLAKYLGQRSLAGQMLILDEPSTGLHPQDISGLLVVMDRLVRANATIVVVEHNTDIIRAADWVIDLGPGAGPAGGRLLYAGAPEGILGEQSSITGQALLEEAELAPNDGGSRPSGASPAPRARSDHIRLRGARANNLKNVDVDFVKGALTVVTGVSGSGKSSLVGDVLEAEANRRFLETLSLYERQGTREGPEAPVDSVSGLGVAITVGPDRRLHSRRTTVGTATEISHHLAVLLTWAGKRVCLACGAAMRREEDWHCPECGATAPLARPRHFLPTNYAAACKTCNGVGTLREPNPSKLIINPERPICDGAMYSPGFFPKGYICKPFNGGYYVLQAMAERYGFDPDTTPWDEMSPQAQQAFLFGTDDHLMVEYRNRKGDVRTHRQRFPGFYGWVGDWDVGGTYTDTKVCPECGGSRLRQEYLAVTLAGHSMHALSEMPLSSLSRVLDSDWTKELEGHLAEPSLRKARHRLRFLGQVGLGYLHLDRDASTLSAGEAQRIKLAGLLGSGLTSLTVLLDEPTRGLHSSEVEGLISALTALRDEGNTVIVVEHDPDVMRAADDLIDMGPGPGVEGGQIVARGVPEQVAAAETITARWLRGQRHVELHQPRQPNGWMTLHGARANNLRGDRVAIPLGTLVGVCGVSGSGKSTLIVDTLGRALAPKKQTTSVAYEPIDPGLYDAIENAPARTLLVDQSRAGVQSPGAFLGLLGALRSIYATCEDALAMGLDEKAFAFSCASCKGRGAIHLDMGFLPNVNLPCEVCRGTGMQQEARDVRVNDISMPDLLGLTLSEVYGLFRDEETLARPLEAALEVGLGYLVLRQPGYALSGGEAQRLRIAAELAKRAPNETLYILDEPTVGQHLEDVSRLSGVLHRLVDAGHTVLVVEHHPHLLACCDWLVELGPGGGPDGGRVIAAGHPSALARGETPTALHLRRVLEGAR